MGSFLECMVVVYLRKCSCTKKNHRKSLFALCTRNNQGPATAKKIMMPAGENNRNISRHLPDNKSHIITIAEGKTIPIKPFVRKARAQKR